MGNGGVAVQDGTKILSGGADNAGRMFDVTTGQASQVAQHDAPIKVVRWIESPQGSVLATGSWDKTVKVRHAVCHSRTVPLTSPSSSADVHSTGTCARPHLSPPSNCRNGVIR